MGKPHFSALSIRACPTIAPGARSKRVQHTRLNAPIRADHSPPIQSPPDSALQQGRLGRPKDTTSDRVRCRTLVEVGARPTCCIHVSSALEAPRAPPADRPAHLLHASDARLDNSWHHAARTATESRVTPNRHTLSRISEAEHWLLFARLPGHLEVGETSPTCSTVPSRTAFVPIRRK